MAELAELKDRPEVQEKLARRIASCSVKAGLLGFKGSGSTGAVLDAAAAAGYGQGAGDCRPGVRCTMRCILCVTCKQPHRHCGCLQVLNPPRPGKKLLVVDIDYTSSVWAVLGCRGQGWRHAVKPRLSGWCRHGRAWPAGTAAQPAAAHRHAASHPMHCSFRPQLLGGAAR